MTYEITGIDEADQLLTKIGPRAAFNLMRSTLSALARDIAKDASEYAPRNTGDLDGNIKSKRMRSLKGSSTLSAAAYVRGGASGDLFYWRFLEHGQGPDGVEHAFFARATENYRRDQRAKLEHHFVKKFEAMLRRAAKN